MHQLRAVAIAVICLLSAALSGAPTVALAASGASAQKFADELRQETQDLFEFTNRKIVLPESSRTASASVPRRYANQFDLFAIIEEAGSQEGYRKPQLLLPSRIVIFGRNSQVRFIDRRLPLDRQQALKCAAAALAEAAELFRKPENCRPILMEVKTGDGLRKQYAAELRFVAVDLKRLLSYLPGAIVVEPDDPNFPSPYRLLLEFTPAGPAGYTVTIGVTPPGGEPERKTFPDADRIATMKMFREIAAMLAIPEPAEVPDFKTEGQRLYREHFYLRFSELPDSEAMPKAIAAVEQNPWSIPYRAWLLDTLNMAGSENKSPDMLLKELDLIAETFDTYPGNYDAYLTGCYLSTLNGHLSRIIYSPRKDAAARWLTGRREIHLELFRKEAPLPRNGAELYKFFQKIETWIDPDLYLNSAAYTTDLYPILEEIRPYADQLPELDLHEVLYPLLSNLRDDPEVQARFQELFLQFRHPDFQALGLTLELFAAIQRNPAPKNRKKSLAVYAQKLNTLPKRCRDPEYTPYWNGVDTRDVIAALQRQKSASRNPQNGAFRTPEKMAELLRAEQPSALELHASPWKEPLSRLSASLRLEQLVKLNPNYRITPVPETRHPHRLAAAIDDGKDGYLLFRRTDRQSELLKWISAERKTVSLARFDSGDNNTPPVIAVAGDTILIGDDGRIILCDRETAGEPRMLSGFSEGKLQALAMLNGRIYALLFDRGVTSLYSCLPDGGDRRRHADTPTLFASQILAADAKKGELIFVAAAKDGLAALHTFRPETGAAKAVQALAQGKHVFRNQLRNESGFRQNGEYIDIAIAELNRSGPQNLPYAVFLSYYPKTGGGKRYCWGTAELFHRMSLQPAWGEELNFSGAFLLENDNFWCAGGSDPNAMMAHLRTDVIATSPKLIFPAVDALFPGASPDCVVVYWNNQLLEIQYESTILTPPAR